MCLEQLHVFIVKHLTLSIVLLIWAMIDIMIEVMLPEEGVEDALIDADDVEHMWYKSKLGNSCVWLIEQRLEKHLENTFGTRTAKRNTCNIKLFLMCLLATETSNVLKIKQNLLAFQINPSCLLSPICAVFNLLKHYDYKSCVLSSWGDLSFYVVGQYCQREYREYVPLSLALSEDFDGSVMFISYLFWHFLAENNQTRDTRIVCSSF